MCSFFAFEKTTLRRFFLLTAILCSLSLPTTVTATTRPDAVKDDAGIEQRLNEQLDLALRFRGIDGSERSLKEWMLVGRPLIIAPVYYECPRLCSLTLNGVSKLLNELDLKLGSDYNVLAITFNDAHPITQIAETLPDPLTQYELIDMLDNAIAMAAQEKAQQQKEGE